MQIRTERFEDFYEIYEDLGSGQFAVVKRCKNKDTCVDYAAKYVKKRKAGSRRGLAREKILQEIEILSELKHKNIIECHEVFETEMEIIIVLELVSGGELFDYISEKDHLSEEEAAHFITQLLEGIDHFHGKSILHLDLKPENVMLLDKRICLIKIIDFGISRKLKPGEKVMETYGTPEFVAPEIIQYQPISTATDMWSVGVITYILLSGASPFLGDNKQETFANITNIDYSFDDEYFEGTSDLAKDFIAKLFVKDPRKRANVKDCLDHPWIKPLRKQDEDERRQAQINIEHFKSFIARRRWKVQMSHESRITRTVITNYRDSDGVVRSKRRAEMSGKSEMYEGEYSESDTSDTEGGGQQQAGDWHSTRQRLVMSAQPPNIELKPVKISEYNETIDDDDDVLNVTSQKPIESLGADLASKLSLVKQIDPNENLISHESKNYQTSDLKTVEHVDEATGASVCTSIRQNVNTNEDIKISKIDQEENIEETDDMIVKKITTKTRTLKTVKKTTTTTTSTKGTQQTT